MNTKDTELIYEAYKGRVVKLNAYEAEYVIECLSSRVFTDLIIEGSIEQWALQKAKDIAANKIKQWWSSTDNIPAPGEPVDTKQRMIEILKKLAGPAGGIYKVIEVGLGALSDDEISKLMQSRLNIELIKTMLNLKKPGLGDTVYKMIGPPPLPKPVPKNIPRPYFPSPFEVDSDPPRQLSTESAIIRRDLILKIENDILYSSYN
jgi:hypothetical protein